MANTLPQLPPEFAEGLRLIDEAHAQDPRKTDESKGSEPIRYELHYAQKMTRWLQSRSPEATPVLQLACRAQHFRRWETPRDTFPMTRPGYLTWRAKLKSQAAAAVADLLASQTSISPADCDRIAALIRKENLGSDGDTQVLEDVACLVFLDDQFDGFEARPDVDEDKMMGILRKTWGKMSEEGRELAVGMDLSDRAKVLIGRALEANEG